MTRDQEQQAWKWIKYLAWAAGGIAAAGSMITTLSIHGERLDKSETCNERQDRQITVMETSLPYLARDVAEIKAMLKDDRRP